MVYTVLGVIFLGALVGAAVPALLSLRGRGLRMGLVHHVRALMDHPHIARSGDFTNVIFLHHSTGRNLIREGKVRELHGDGPDRFDPFTHPHYHFRCQVCGRVFDVKTPYREELDRVDLGPGFSVHGHELTWVGICPECRRKGGEGG